MSTNNTNENILDSPKFKKVMHFKFFMVIVVWGLIPLIIPKSIVPHLGLHLSDFQMTMLRIWGLIVLLDFFVYWYIYRKPHSKWTRYLLLFGVIDNAGLGIILLILTPIYDLPWGVWINIPFQLYFGYWFWRFYKEGFGGTDNSSL